MRPQLFLDTNVCINVANGNVPADEWQWVQKHIAACYDYSISFITMKELFGRLARCKAEFFLQNKEPLHVLLAPGSRFLPHPSIFALRTVLGLQELSRKSEFVNLRDEELSERVLAAVLAAPSKAQLKAGIPIPNQPGQLQSFDLDHFDQHETQPQIEFADILQGIREDRTDMPKPLTWVANLLNDHGFTPLTDQCEKLSVALDAAYRFSCTLSKLSKDTDYDFHRHQTNWGDALQLFYLCDESMHFLTFDGKCRTQANPSSQTSRILVYPEFVRSL